MVGGFVGTVYAMAPELMVSATAVHAAALSKMVLRGGMKVSWLVVWWACGSLALHGR